MRRLLLAAIAMLTVSLAAHADTMQYTVTEDGIVSTFDLPQQPTPLGVTSSDFQVLINVTTNDQAAPEYVFFSLPDSPYCLFSLGGKNCDTNGADVYFTGSATTPTLLPGTFTFQDAYDPTETVTVDAVDIAATPEPSSIALLGTGLLGVAGIVRKRLV